MYRFEIHDINESLFTEREADVDNVEVEAIDSSHEVDVVNSINTDDINTDDISTETSSLTSGAENIAENVQVRNY